MTDDAARTLTGSREIASFLRHLWLVERHKRVPVSHWTVARAYRLHGLPAERIGRALVANAIDVEAWWRARIKPVVGVGPHTGAHNRSR